MQRKGFVGEPSAVLVQFASAAATSVRFNEGLEFGEQMPSLSKL